MFKTQVNKKVTLKFDPESRGLSKVFKDYQQEALRAVWKSEKGAISREVWQHVNGRLDGGGSISRASIINFLNDMVDEGVLDYHEESGKGGFHRVYKPKMDESELKKYIAETVLASLMRDFPHSSASSVSLIPGTVKLQRLNVLACGSSTEAGPNWPSVRISTSWLGPIRDSLRGRYFVLR